TLLQRLGRRVGAVASVAIAGEMIDVEDVPLGQGAVAGEIKLAGANAADRHADARQFVAAVNFRLPLSKELLEPRRVQLLVGRDVVNNRLLIRAGQLDKRQANHAGARGQEVAAGDRRSGVRRFSHVGHGKLLTQVPSRPARYKAGSLATDRASVSIRVPDL